MFEHIYRYLTIEMLIWIAPFAMLCEGLFAGAIAFAAKGNKRSIARPIVSLGGFFFPLISLAAAVIIFFTITGFDVGRPTATTGVIFSWVDIPSLSISTAIKLDELSLLMMLAVTALSFVVHMYSIGFISEEPSQPRLFSYLGFFSFFMLCSFMVDDLVMMLAGWMMAMVVLVLGISFKMDDKEASFAAARTLVFGIIGSLALLAAAFFIYGVMSAAGVDPKNGMFNFTMMEMNGAFFLPVAKYISLLVLFGVAALVAQVPFSIWLAESELSPPPAAAFMQSSVFVAAGVYLIARLGFIFTESQFALSAVAAIGTLSVLFGAIFGLVATDIRKILGFSVISQMGFMFIAAGVGAFPVMVFHLVTFIFFMPLLFLCAGSVIQATGGLTDIRDMGGLKRRMPLTAWTFVIAAAALAGIVPTVGFFSKQAILWQIFDRGHYFIWTMAFLGEGICAFYIFRAVGLIFFGDSNITMDKWKRAGEAPISMSLAMLIIATLLIIGGWLGVPECIRGSDRLAVWLSKLLPNELGHAPKKGTSSELILMVANLIWTVHFAIMGLIIYAQRRDLPARITDRVKWLHIFFERNCFISEVYEWSVARPVSWAAKNIFSRGVNDALLGTLICGQISKAASFIGGLVQTMQNGELSRYMLYFLLGAAIVVASMAL